MSFIGGGIGGDAGPDLGGNRGGGGANRKNTKKFGKNLNKLTKAPAAPPVPVISPGSGAGSSSSFRGSSSNRNGLLLLSTKSKSSSGVGGGGLLAASGTPKTAHDALLLSAGARDVVSTKKQPAHAWGAGGAKDKETVSSVDFRGADYAAEVGTGTSNSDSTLDRRDSSLQRQRSSTHRWTEQTSSLDNRGAEKSVLPEQRDSFAGGQRPSSDRWTVGDVTDHVSNISLSKIHTGKDASKDMQLNYRSSTSDILQANENADVRESKTEATNQNTIDNSKDYQAEYMSKLARERAEKLRLEEEARVAAQKERAAMRLRVLEEKRLEERKRLLIQNQERRELSRPSSQVILEPLGKPKKNTSTLLPPKPTISAQQVEKKEDRRTLYDPDRSFSSLVGGKTVKSNSINNAELPRGSAKQSPVHVPAMSSASTDYEKDNSPKPVHMVQLSNLDELDRGGRGEGQGVQRMLFDPNSGSMIAVLSREDPKSAKKAKQKATPKGPVDKIVVESPDSKMVRGKLGKGSSRKEEPISLQQRNKKPLDKGKQTPRKRVPRTCGVLYKIDKSGNYLNVDESEPDEGYGAHLVPGGKIKNPGAHANVVKQQEVNDTLTQPKTTSTTATDGFSFRNDPGFLQHQTNFEAQQQKILEDAWASLVENDEPMTVESNEMAKKELPATKSGDDEYAAALEISPSIIGLNFDSIDTMDSVMLPPAIKVNGSHNHEESIALATNFTLGATSSVNAVQSANPFVGPLGGVPGASLWGTSNTGASSSAYDLSALTGWNPTPFGETDSTLVGSVGLTGSTSQSSKLHLWGSSALDDN